MINGNRFRLRLAIGLLLGAFLIPLSMLVGLSPGKSIAVSVLVASVFIVASEVTNRLISK